MIEFGLLLPHFSDATSWDRLFGFAPRIEQLGYGSVWARDNLGFHGHGFELEGDFFLDPFTTLAGVAALTSTLRLGTAVLTPFRHPLVTAQLIGGLDFLSRGRFVLGVGPGTPRKPWEAVGRVYEERVVAAREMVQVLRLMSSGDVESYAGELTSFVDVKLDPPPPADLTIWYGGASNASVRAVVEYADGMLPGRCPFHRYDVAVDRLRTAAAEAGRAPRLGSIPIVSVGATNEAALDQIPVKALLETASVRWKRPCETVDDIAGALVVGDPAACVEQIQAFVERDVELLVVDLRLQMPAFEDAVEMFAAEVMPAFTPLSQPS